MMLKLFCMIVDVGGSAFSVRLDDGDQVDDLKDAIRAKNEDLKCPARNLRLYLAKMTNRAWLKDDDSAAKQLYIGKTHKDIQDVIDGEQVTATWTLKRWLFEENKMSQPSTEQIHVLVVVPEENFNLEVQENEDEAKLKDELTHYQQRGEMIQRKCKDYCQQILSKIDAVYARRGRDPLPFICVEGSSGMGKSQLAFALGGSRPWFYWPVAIGLSCQCLYKNFESIADAFRKVTYLDDPTKKHEEAILNTKSYFYDTESLWTFGLIRALLKYYSIEQNQKGQMIRFQEKTSLYVEKCNRKKIVACREKMKVEGKVLPFFVLDEMTPNINMDGCGKNLAAFQRNVFRVCGLVVVVMGTDAKITNLVGQSVGSYAGEHVWMTVFSRFPPYQSIPFAAEDKQTAWDGLQTQFPVLNDIVVNSRGRFARYFADRAAQYAMDNPANGIKLCDLLNVAFDHVSSETQGYKPFMVEQEGKDAQLMAISYTNVGTRGTSPPPCKKRKTDLGVGTHCMHLHFANLVDDQGTDVNIRDGRLMVEGESWKPLCCFPDIKEDWLLYLAILGGKNYSGYYDRNSSIDHSTLGIFSAYLKGQGFSTGENTNAVSNDFKTYENMVAHMIFCASRWNGVQGIPFDDFFVRLLKECQDKIQPVTMTVGDTGETIVASDLLDKYTGLAALSRSKIPFLAPPNAEWPPWILATRKKGCNFGHLVRAQNDERCDLYLCNMEGLSKPPLFFCECKFWEKNVDLSAMNKIIDGLESVWDDNWALALVFCVKLATFTNEWERKKVGCVKVNCRSGRVDWVFQPVEGAQKKLVIVMETGPLKKVTDKSASAKLD